MATDEILSQNEASLTQPSMRAGRSEKSWFTEEEAPPGLRDGKSLLTKRRKNPEQFPMF